MQHILTSTLRNCARAASFIYRAGGSVDDAMARIIEVRGLRTQGRSQALSLIGSGAILIAVFAPIANVPVLGAVTYFNGESKFAIAIGVLALAIGISSLTFALIEKYAWLYGIGFCSLAISIGTLAGWKWYLARTTSEPSAPPAGLLDYFTHSASKELVGRSSLGFGPPLLIYGAVLVILAALVRPRELAVPHSKPRPG